MFQGFHDCFGDLNLSTFGFEIGNWYGFSGVPMNTGIASFSEVIAYGETPGNANMTALVKMKKLYAQLQLEVSYSANGFIVELRATSLADSVLGDLVIHYGFSQIDKNVIFGNECVNSVNKYQRSRSGNYTLTLSEKKLVANSEVEMPAGMDMNITPYTTLTAGGGIRHHMRLLCEGGENSHILLRTRGAMSCIQICKSNSILASQLYRREKKAPRIFPNTQLCGVTPFNRGDAIRIKQIFKFQ